MRRKLQARNRQMRLPQPRPPIKKEPSVHSRKLFDEAPGASDGLTQRIVVVVEVVEVALLVARRDIGVAGEAIGG